jgi:hypothetical protein
MGRYDHLWEKEKTNKHASVIFLLAKNTNSTFFQIGALNLYRKVPRYTESDGVIAIKIL